jgi:Ser/Thr protein kinase RdoA (MazF antagonist)
LLDPATLRTLCEPFGLLADHAKFVSRSQNDVYAFSDSILRISYDRGQSSEWIDSELQWIDDLAARGLSVCRARPSQSGRRCECIVVDGVEYLVTHFERAPGHKVQVSDVDDALYASLGRLTADMHAASFDSSPPAKERFSRPAWHESRLLNGDVRRYTPATNERFRLALRRLVDDLKGGAEPAGLVHGDISFTNVFLHRGSLTLFDFDNCEVGSVLQDLATVFYDAVYCHLLNRVAPSELQEIYRRRCRVFLAGYRTRRTLSTLPTDRLRDFLVLREAVIYTHYCRTLDPAKMTPGFRQGLMQMRVNVEQRVSEAGFEER